MFLCTGNSCRIQIAEGFAREIGKGLIEVDSTGLKPAGINPKAITVMREIGIDISKHRSRAIDLELLNQMDVIITLCGNVEASCPMTPPGIRRIHWSIDDPVGATGTGDEIMKEFRTARDEIKERTI
jgi:arsenate reductase